MTLSHLIFTKGQDFRDLSRGSIHEHHIFSKHAPEKAAILGDLDLCVPTRFALVKARFIDRNASGGHQLVKGDPYLAATVDPLVLLENLPCLAQSYIGILPKAAGLELTHGGTATPRERSSDPDPTPEDVELATNDESRLGSHDGMFWYTTTRGVALKIRVNLDPGWADGTTMIRSPESVSEVSLF